MINSQNISKGLVLLMVFLQIGLPAIYFGEYGDISTKEVSIDQVYGDFDSLNHDLVLNELEDSFSKRVDLGSTLFYTLSHFSLDLFHGGQIRIQWVLAHLVNLSFTKSDIIFPFAYFW